MYCILFIFHWKPTAGRVEVPVTGKSNVPVRQPHFLFFFMLLVLLKAYLFAHRHSPPFAIPFNYYFLFLLKKHVLLPEDEI